MYQWHPFFCVYIHQEDFNALFISSNDEREVLFLVAMTELHVPTSSVFFGRLPLDLVDIFSSFKDCEVMIRFRIDICI